MFGNATIFLLVALAAERYFAVVHPLALQRRRVSPFTWSVFCVLLTWALATVLAVPDFFAHNMEDLLCAENGAGTDGPKYHACLVYAISWFIFFIYS